MRGFQAIFALVCGPKFNGRADHIYHFRIVSAPPPPGRGRLERLRDIILIYALKVSLFPKLDLIAVEGDRTVVQLDSEP